MHLRGDLALATIGLMLFVVSSSLLSHSLVLSATSATFTNGQHATLVLGQPDFISSSFSATPSAMGLPFDIAVDPTTGKVFVADSGNDRVLRFASLAALTSGASAEGVLGQLSLTGHISTMTQYGMFAPDAVAIDNSGRLWVADRGNNRVLRFDSAASKANGANADGVLGQPTFTSNSPALTQSGMNYPGGVAVDGTGRLWVADEINSRVLRFDNAASKADGAPADGVLGQAAFTSNMVTTSQSTMNDPKDVAIDSSGRLWVADYANNRVLWFESAASKANGANADGVVGQPTFASNTRATSQSGMAGPVGVAVDSADRLWVADSFNSRVLLFVGQPPPVVTATATPRATPQPRSLVPLVIK